MTDAIDSFPSIGLSTLPMADLVRRGAIDEVRKSSPSSPAEEILVAVALAQIGVVDFSGSETGALSRLERAVRGAEGQVELSIAARIELCLAQLEALKPRNAILDALKTVETELNSVTGRTGDALRARAAVVRGRTLLRNRNILDARAAMQTSLDLATSIGDRYGVAEAELALGMADAWNGRPRPAERHFSTARVIWTELGNRIRLGDVDYESGIRAFDTREYGEARGLFDRSREIADAAGAGAARILRIGYQQGAAALAAGDVAAAEAHLSAILDAAVKASDPYRAMMCRIDLGRCALQRARVLKGSARAAALSLAKGMYADVSAGLSEQDREPGAFGGLHATLLEAGLMSEGVHYDGLTPADGADLLGRSADAFGTLDRERPRCLMFRIAAAEAYGEAAAALKKRWGMKAQEKATLALMKARRRVEAAAACELAASMGINLARTEKLPSPLRLSSQIESREVSGITYVRMEPEPGETGMPWTPIDNASS